MKPKLYIAIFTVLFLLILGTIIFRIIEDWSWIDALYFTAITVTTVGYGDLVPTHDVSKIFTIILSFAGIGIVLYALWIIAAQYFGHQKNFLDRFKQEKENSKEKEL